MNKFKEEEKHLIELLSHLKVKSYKISQPKSDPPDLILEQENIVLGVEHTRLYNNNKKAQITEWEKLMSYCEIELRKNGFKDCVIRLTPNKINLLSKKRRLIIQKGIIEIIKSNINILTDKKIDLSSNPFPELHKIKGFKNKGEFIITFDSLNWKSNSFVTRSLINQIVKKKSNKISKIDNKMYNELWLLIVIEGNMYSDSPKLKRTEIIKEKNEFDKTFLIHLKNKWFVELNNSA